MRVLCHILQFEAKYENSKNHTKGIVHILGYKSGGNGLLPMGIHCSDIEESICYGRISES